MWRVGGGGKVVKIFVEKIVQVVSQLVHDNGEETAGHSQRSTLETGQVAIRDFAKIGAISWLEGSWRG